MAAIRALQARWTSSLASRVPAARAVVASGPATTSEECQEKIGIALTCDDAGVEIVAFVPGVTCTGMSSLTESERVIFETDLDINVAGIRIEEVLSRDSVVDRSSTCSYPNK